MRTIRTAGIGLSFGVACFAIWAVISIQGTQENPVPYSPRAAAQDFEGLNVRLQLLQTEGQVDWAGLAELRQTMVSDLKTGALESVSALAQAQAPLWSEVGPSVTSGRTRALTVWHGDSLLAGGVSGGLWMSGNRGGRWQPVGSFPSLMVGSVAVTGNGTIYVGTGSNYDGAGGQGGSGFRGDGIWMSEDNGASWTMVSDTDGYDATDDLEADPTNPDRVWYASVDGYGSITNGVLVEVPGGSNSPSNASDVAIAPDGSYCLVAGINGRVYRSVGGDFGSLQLISQSSTSNGFLPQSGIGRARIDIAQTPNADGTYNAFSLYATSGGLFYGLYFSDGAGAGGTWQEVWPGGLQNLTPLPRSQGIYDLALGISPMNPRLAYVGGIELWRSGPEQQAELAANPIDFPGYDYAMHPDIHEIVGVADGTMYFCTDGGVYRSDDGGLTFREVNDGLNISQFYGIAHGPDGEMLGGTQDNGSLLMFVDESNAVQVRGGDGFDCAISQRRSTLDSSLTWVATSQNGGLVRGRLTNGEVQNSGSFYDGNFTDLFTEDGNLGQFYTCIRMYEDELDSGNDMFILGLNGGLGVWMTRGVSDFNSIPSWVRIADAPSGFSGTKAMEFVEHGDEAGDVMFLTGWNGQVTRVSGLANVNVQDDVSQLSVQNVLSSAGAAVTGLSVDPNDANHVVISVGGYGTSSAGKVRETFNALDDNVSWSNIWSSSGYNNMPCYDVLVDALDASGQTIYVATEFGIFVTENGGDSWVLANEGMASSSTAPFAPVFDLKQQTKQGASWSDVTNFGAMFAGSHGRGMYTTLPIEGCTDEAACNYWRGATVDNGTCEYTSCAGCADPASCNYNATATQLEACDYGCYGCTDPDAANYDAEALIEDGSCVPDFESCEQLLNVEWAASGLGWWPGDTLLWEAASQEALYTAFVMPDSLTDNAITYATSSFEFLSASGMPEGVTLDAGEVGAGETACWPLTGVIDSVGTYPIVVQGNVLIQIFFSTVPVPFTFQTVLQVTAPQSLLGCTYGEAVNYEPLSTVDDGTCVFQGCTDPEALNYSPAFSVSDDSCIYSLTNPTCPEDLTEDGYVNTSDLLLFLGVYGEICN